MGRTAVRLWLGFEMWWNKDSMVKITNETETELTVKDSFVSVTIEEELLGIEFFTIQPRQSIDFFSYRMTKRFSLHRDLEQQIHIMDGETKLETKHHFDFSNSKEICFKIGNDRRLYFDAVLKESKTIIPGTSAASSTSAADEEVRVPIED
ncbi:hypothetical protein ABFS83_01G042100 [Erythranthe nasuta]